MKNFFIIMFLVFSFGFIANAQKEKDIWSGAYAISYQPKDSKVTIAIDTLIIAPSRTLTADEVPSRFESDLKRWSIRSINNLNEEKKIRRFLFDSENNEYEQFGWTDLHKQNKIECIDAGHFFICYSSLKGEIKIGNESIFTETGIFGIRLHFGLFHLKKLTIINPKSS